MDDLLNSIASRRLSEHLSDLGSGLKYIGAIAGFTFNAIAYPFAGLYDMALNEKGWGKKDTGTFTDTAAIMISAITAFNGASMMLYSHVKGVIPESRREDHGKLRKLHVGRIFCGVSVMFAMLLGILLLTTKAATKSEITKGSPGHHIHTFCAFVLCVAVLYILYSFVVDARIYLRQREFTEEVPPQSSEQREGSPSVPETEVLDGEISADCAPEEEGSQAPGSGQNTPATRTPPVANERQNSPTRSRARANSAGVEP
ncbi:hypothetical protein [Streptomyces anulatus]|uniref:Uncharacterized protein n=1 Tax=Streptomyces anulatus TaxID=1892 RepID=A0A7K3RJE5_STRAQ|nr:hypothetical protein [Streptomyces anulatus]NEC02288.1 hypothetical protein [Streptomyces anulatus]NED29375.1 hypothetical protein [Streptomyces anulatus]